MSKSAVKDDHFNRYLQQQKISKSDQFDNPLQYGIYSISILLS